jgi:hypothetical protein
VSLTLHRTKGVNPRLTVCEGCGKDVGVMLLGTHDYTTTCKPCGIVLIGGGPCPRCRRDGTDRRTLDHAVRIPEGLCDDCARREAEARAEVEKGGVFWRCVDCRAAGAIKAGARLAEMVRRQANVPVGPCGIEFSKADCPVCAKKGEG